MNTYDPKFSDRQVWANNVDPRGVVWSGTTLFAIPSASFGRITLCALLNYLVQILGWLQQFFGWKCVWIFTVLGNMSRDMTKPTKWVCAQHRLRSAWASAQVWSVFAVRMKKAWVLSYPLSAQWRLWSDWADAQADPSLRWAHSHFVGFVVSRLICPKDEEGMAISVDTQEQSASWHGKVHLWGFAARIQLQKLARILKLWI